MINVSIQSFAMLAAVVAVEETKSLNAKVLKAVLCLLAGQVKGVPHGQWAQATTAPVLGQEPAHTMQRLRMARQEI